MKKNHQNSGESGSKKGKRRPATSPEARENQMIALAMDLAEKKLRDGTASSQLLTEFVKRGSTKARLEQEMLETQKEMMIAKTEMIKSAKRVEELYEHALDAMREYSGQEKPQDDPEDI